MRARIKASVWGFTALAALTTAAAAEERLQMPFACHVEGGRVVLSPSDMQSYRIYGAPEHRKFTACSPVQFRNSGDE